MTVKRKAGRKVLRDLGDGLILRRATVEDTDALAAFNCDIHCREEERRQMGAWFRDLASGRHPALAVSDFTIVEDVKAGEIASSLCLFSQTWSYDGVEFGVGQPELAGTRPQYRRRGLVCAQFEVIHEWSARRKQKMQAITGIPNFYRQFGYEMALEHSGLRRGHKSEAPALKRGEKEPYRVRAAKDDDLAFMARVYREGMRRYLVACVRGAATWKFELSGRSRRSGQHDLRVIESREGERVGLLVYSSALWPLWHKALAAQTYELKPGVSWLAVTPSVIRHLVATGEARAARSNKQFEFFAFALGSEHPVYQVAPSLLAHSREPWAYYVRVPDLPDFLRHISPVLEQRLAESPAVGHTGELKLSFYRDGLRLRFERGRLAEVEPWQPGGGQSAAFPGLTFLQVLFGRRSAEELGLAYRDCLAADDEARLLLRGLFPKKPSAVWSIS